MMDDDTVLFLAGKGRDNKQKRNGSSVVIKSDIETVNEFLSKKQKRTPRPQLAY